MPISQTAAAGGGLMPTKQGTASQSRNLLLTPLGAAPPPQAAPAAPPGALQPGPAAPNMLLGAGGRLVAPQAPPQQANPITAAIAQHLQSLPPDKLAREADRADYMFHSYGTLARKPDLTLKDVISQAGQAVADGKATPEEAVKEVAGLPQDPTALRAALQQRFKGMIISAAMLARVKGTSGANAAPAASPETSPTGAPPQNLTQVVV